MTTIGEHWASFTTDQEWRAYLLKMCMRVFARRDRDKILTVIELHGVHTDCQAPGCPECGEAKEIMDCLGSVHRQFLDRPDLRHLIDTGLTRWVYEDMLCLAIDRTDEKARNLAHFFSNLIDGMPGVSKECTYCTAPTA